MRWSIVTDRSAKSIRAIGPHLLRWTEELMKVEFIRGYYPLEYVSIRLVEELSKQINSGGEIPSPPFSRIMPAGWFEAEFVVASSEDGLEETQSFLEFVMVYEDATAKFEKFMNHFLRQMPEGWDREFLPPEGLSHRWMLGWLSSSTGNLTTLGTPSNWT